MNTIRRADPNGGLASMHNSVNRAENLDALRGIAVILVLASHSYIAAVPSFAQWEATNINLGTIGVLIFFCVSGYVISWSIADLTGVGGWHPVCIFGIRRIFRLMPAYIILAVALMLFVIPNEERNAINSAFGRAPVAYLIEFLTFTTSFANEPTPFGGLEWTLSYEVIFYLFCAVYLLFNKILNDKIYLIGVALALSFITLLPTGTFNNVPQVMCLRFEFFLVGVIVFLLKKDACRNFLLWSLCALSVVTILARCSLTTLAYHRLYSETLASPVALLIFFGTIAWGRRLPALLAKIGIISYSVYLLHPAMPILLPVTWMPIWGRLSVWTASSLVCASLVYVVIERPSIRLGKRAIAKLKKCHERQVKTQIATVTP
jgi:peptidoglycan/LPS O-acetylase OafA/YrhL